MLFRKILLAAVMFPLFALAQQKEISISDAVMYGRTSLAPKKLNQLQWMPGSTALSYVDTLNRQELLYSHSVVSKATKVMLPLSELNAAMRSAGFDTLKRFEAITWAGPAVFTFTSAKRVLAYDLLSKKISKRDTITLPDEAEDAMPGPNDLVAYRLKNNLYIEQDHKQRMLTSDATYALEYGSKKTHREEFGIHEGIFWSPKGTSLAFYRMDQTMVTDYPIVDYSVKPAKDKPIKYPFAGETSHEVTIGVYNLETAKTIYLKTGKPADQYLTNVCWSPDEKLIYVAIVNREQNHMWLNTYNAQTGDFVRTLFEETDPKYTEPLHAPLFVPGHPDQFIWHSRRDGNTHLYLYNTSGKLIRQLTSGNWEVMEFSGFDTKGTKAFYLCTANGGNSREFGGVNLSSGKMWRIGKSGGMRACILSPDGKYIVDNYSSMTVPRVYTLWSTEGKQVSEIFRASNPIKDFAIGETKLFTIPSNLGDSLHCRMVTPPNMDPSKKYPVIVYVYGGPHIQLVNDGWLGGGELWYQHMAQKGFILFTLDNHGSGNRGKAFEQVVFRQLGTQEMNDQLAGVAYLKSLPYVDTTRMGVHGWSFGGFMTTSLMTRNPGVFKVAVAGGPVIDWSYYEIMYTERYMDQPQTNKEGYDKSNLLNYVDQLSGKLMLIHGTNDDAVMWQHSLMYLKKAVSKGKQVDYMVYPGHLHNVLGKDRVHLMTKVCDYFIQNL